MLFICVYQLHVGPMYGENKGFGIHPLQVLGNQHHQYVRPDSQILVDRGGDLWESD